MAGAIGHPSARVVPPPSRVLSAQTASSDRAAPGADISDRHNEGHGRRLTAAFEALEAFPALVESRNRALLVSGDDHASAGEVVCAVESDVALTIAVLRTANRMGGKRRRRVESVGQAVEVLSPAAVQVLLGRIQTFDFFERGGPWDMAPERFRLHALACQRAADRLAGETGYGNRDRLMASALLHDIGKLVLLHAYPGYPEDVQGTARTPEERVHQERRELGVDHALVGGVLARRWGLPKSIASAIERHHSQDCEGDAAFVRLADMLAHYGHGGPISPAGLLKTARVVGLGPPELRRVVYELPYPREGHQRAQGPCPLSDRELDVLRGLAQGKVYKQIASELALSTSTVRSHLHNVYGKLGAVDRAQAVLSATQRGWL
jgi:putative nucleotidyltransferase with HDIG domain